LRPPSTTTRSMAGADQERLARILDDYLVAIERGLPVSPEELLEKYPDDAAQLCGYLSGLQLFHAAAGISPGPATSSLTSGAIPASIETIGDYRLLREIGRGGMGVVYEALQLSLQRHVALKILPFTAGHDAKQIIRFKNEAQAAAQVQHPNIVPVYAIGEESGLHYYVMQLVEGQSLAGMLEVLRSDSGIPPKGKTEQPGNSVTISSLGRAAETLDHIRVVARLALQAAQALRAAHEYGVVHRDIKPSNLLLDNHSKLWVTDFGLARCRESEELTRTGDILGTMRYMSPEQALGRNGLIDHRTDVYSLGITMYELATLHHPADEASDIQMYFDREREPPKSLRHWNRHIPRDFQTIVLKCLAELPHERYASAKDLAEDLERFLDGRTILASPPTLLSRASKWARRRRGLVYATAAVLFVAVTGAATSMTMLSHERNAANKRALDQTRQFVRETWDAFNPSQYSDRLAAIPGAEGVRQQMLLSGVELFKKYEKEAAGDPVLATDWALAESQLGTLNEKLRQTGPALEAHSKARDVWRKLLDRDPTNAEYARQVARSQNNMGLLMSESGRAAEGLVLLTQARDSLLKLAGDDSRSIEIATDLATTHANIGLVLSQTGKKSNAIKELSAAIAIQERLAESPNANEAVKRSLAASYNNLASLQDDAAAKTASDAYLKAIEIERKLVKADPINRIHQADLAKTYSNLGFLSSRRKDWNTAESCYDAAILLQKELVRASPLAAAYRRDLAISYNNLGMVQSRVGSRRKAEDSFREAARLQEALLSAQPSDAETLSNQGSVWNNLGMLFDQQQRFAEAEKAYQQAIASQRRALETAPTNDRYRALLSGHYINYGRNAASQGRFDSAMEIARTRKQLWQGHANGLFSVGQQLADLYRRMRSAVASPQTQSECVREAVASLREAIVAGLPSERLNDPSLASLAGSREFRQLLDETTAGVSNGETARQTASNSGK